MIKRTKIVVVTPYLHENFLVLAFDIEWINVFGTIPEFDVFLDDDKKIHLISKQVVKK